MHFDVIDGCPVPQRLAPAIRRIKQRSGASLNSCDRSPEAEPMLQKLGKMSQRQLYEGWKAGRQGFNPANPPGFSTHERRNDGVAFPGPRGARLPYWCVGIDCTNTAAFVQAAKSEGYLAVVTYPGSPHEGHHVNFRREPRVRLAPRPLQQGATGPRVVALTRRLSFVRSPAGGPRYLDGKRWTFDAETEAALKRFQEDHHQRADGIYGPLSHRQLLASVRWRKRHGG
jgi:hypothetical protein